MGQASRSHLPSLSIFLSFFLSIQFIDSLYMVCIDSLVVCMSLLQHGFPSSDSQCKRSIWRAKCSLYHPKWRLLLSVCRSRRSIYQHEENDSHFQMRGYCMAFWAIQLFLWYFQKKIVLKPVMQFCLVSRIVLHVSTPVTQMSHSWLVDYASSTFGWGTRNGERHPNPGHHTTLDSHHFRHHDLRAACVKIPNGVVSRVSYISILMNKCGSNALLSCDLWTHIHIRKQNQGGGDLETPGKAEWFICASHR